VPDTLFIRNETNHSQLIDNVGTVDVRFFGDSEVYTRDTDDGTVNMSGLPVGQSFIVTASPPDGTNYTDRTVFVTNIYEQQSVYLLNTSINPTITGRFVLDDPTGQFGSDSVLYIEKPINVSGTVQYQTIHADEFGAEGVTATLQESERTGCVSGRPTAPRRLSAVPRRGERNHHRAARHAANRHRQHERGVGCQRRAGQHDAVLSLLRPRRRNRISSPSASTAAATPTNYWCRTNRTTTWATRASR